MATTYAIPDGRKHFDVVTFTGTGTTQTISGLLFGPDFIWGKSRSAASSHRLLDRNRGVTEVLYSDSTAAGGTEATTLTSFNADGYTMGIGGSLNPSGVTMVDWLWKAGGTAVSNTAGSITSSVSANTTAGFSVCTWTGTGSAATIGHGLGVAPAMYITKQRSATGNWFVYHQSVGATKGLFLDLTNAATTNTYFNNTAPTSTVFSIGSGVGGLNASGVTQVTYCFAPVAGYSAFGSYTGNGSADGPFVYLGFKPRFVMLKRTDVGGSNYNWFVYDSARDTYNATQKYLEVNLSTAEQTSAPVDFLSNGFKVRTASTYWNASGGTFIYMAFAENPFKYANAR